MVIAIKTLNQKTWQTILSQCQGMLESLQDLMNGDFPKAIGEIFTHKDTGLFPSPKEISFSCSCPDYAGMCKHVAATLYGIGARLDESPELFFKMRNVDMDDLIIQAVTDRKEKLLAKASRRSSRVLDEVDLSATFGIDLQQDDPAIPSAPSASPASPKTRSRKAAPEPAPEAKPPKKSPKTAKATKASRKAAARETVPTSSAPSVSVALPKPRQRKKAATEPAAEVKTVKKSPSTAKTSKPSRKAVVKETVQIKTKAGKEKKSESKTRRGRPKAL